MGGQSRLVNGALSNEHNPRAAQENVMAAITKPDRLWSREEVLSRPCPVPAASGVYGWYFRDLPCIADTTGCADAYGLKLLYVGISPSQPATIGKVPTRQNLRKR